MGRRTATDMPSGWREPTDADKRRPARITSTPGGASLLPDGNTDEDEKSHDWLPSPYLLEPQDQFIARFSAAIQAFRKRGDEAARRSITDALAMRTDGVIHSSLRRRQNRTRRLRPRIEADDRRDPAQQKAISKYGKMFDAIPRFGHLRLAMLECQFYGRGGANVVWDDTLVDGRRVRNITKHVPVNGDSIGWLYDDVPTIAISSIAELRADAETGYDDRGQCLILRDGPYRDCFPIQKFEPTATDYMVESDMALSLHGYGLRGRLYWPWRLRCDVQGWFLDAMERIGANGMLVGYYEDGNPNAMNKMIAALKSLQLFSVAALPRPANGSPKDSFDHIDPANVAYDVMDRFIGQQNSIIRQIICGHDADNTGPTKDDADNSESDFEAMVACDAEDHAEALTEGILKPMIRQNEPGGKLPFNLKVRFQPSKKEVGEKMAAVRMGVDLGLEIDKEDLYDIIGIAPPRDGANIIQLPGAGNANGGPGGMPGMQGDQVADTGRSPVKNLAPGANANIPRIARAAGTGGPLNASDVAQGDAIGNEALHAAEKEGPVAPATARPGLHKAPAHHGHANAATVQALNAAGLSRDQIRQRLGVSRSTIGRMIRQRKAG